MKNKISLFIYPIIFFLFLLMNGQTTIVHAETEGAQRMDIFDYEYESQTLEYQIYLLPNDTTQGIAALIGPKDKANLSGEVHIPAAVTYLGETYSVTRIEQNAFRDCINIISVEIPDGLTTIYPNAFENCVKLQSLRLPVAVTSLTTEAFQGTNIIFEVGIDSYAAKFCKDYRLPCIYTAASTESNIPLDDIIIKQRELKLFTGNKGTLNLLYYPFNATDDGTAIWSSSNQGVAAVDANGVVTAVSPGKTKITAVVGTLSAECTVIVNPYSPKLVEAESTGLNSIKISWNAVKGVRGYSIYRATSEKGVYSKVKDISYACYKDATYYEDTNLNYKTTYYYKVRSYDYGTSAFSKVVSAKPKIAVLQVNAASFKNNKIKVQWKWITGSKGYQIYRSSTKTGVFKLYKTVTASYYVDYAVTEGKSYYYYVKAYYSEKNQNIYSEKSKMVSAVAKTPPTPKLITLGTSLGNVYRILGRTNQKVYCQGYLELLYKKDMIYGTGFETAHIYLQKVNNEYVVIGWSNIQHGYLSKFSDGTEQNTGTFTLGSSLIEVNKVMGTPDSYELDFAGAIYYPGDLTIIKKTYIKYPDGSVVSFNSDRKVIGWENKGCLKLKYKTSKPTGASITRGTSLTDVIKAVGNPDKITENGWGYPKYVYYGNTILTFDYNQVLIAWEHKGDMKITIGEKEPAVSKVQVGSSLEEVIQAMGTPDSYFAEGFDMDYLRAMAYGSYNIKFDSKQIVSGISKTEGYLTINVDSVDRNS